MLNPPAIRLWVPQNMSRQSYSTSRLDFLQSHLQSDLQTQLLHAWVSWLDGESAAECEAFAATSETLVAIGPLLALKKEYL
jgi:hypothetical protein